LKWKAFKSPHNKKTEEPTMSKHGTILVIEDDLDDRQMLHEALQEIDSTNPVKFCSTAEDGLNFLKETTITTFVILCDINMPKMNGLELRNIIESDPVLKTKSIPFVFYSTVARQQEVEQAYNLTVQGFFKKPDNFRKLVRQLNLIFEYWQECVHPNSFDK
jgi:CheY-like chemotaxis protein